MNDHRDKSFWLDTHPPYEENPRLEGSQRVDVAVLGAGFTGLSTAYHLRRADPALRVAVLEAEIVGFGASGRNGGFSMTLFGMQPSLTKAMFGAERTREAQRYMERAVDLVDTMVREHDMQSVFWYPGYLHVATTDAHMRRIEKEHRLLEELGITGHELLDGHAVRERVDSPLFVGGSFESRCGILNPARHVRELKRVAEAAGAEIYERTPVESIERGKHFRLRTPGGTVEAERVVIATNAWTHLMAGLHHREAPVFTHMVVTEPLQDKQWDAIGWEGREGLEDARNIIHYLRPTADGRIAIGGYRLSVAFGRDMDRDLNPKAFRGLEKNLVRMFPSLAGVRFTHRWGGAVSVTADLVPAIGQLGDARCVYSVGCIGHGVSLTHLNGQTLADLVLERSSELTETWFVNRRVFPWPPEPLRALAAHAILGYMKAEDRLLEGNKWG
jgi:glycine/D-amino acid oxidase-like deaminating enzyme